MRDPTSLVLVVGFLAACSGSTAPREGNPADVVGTWDWVEHFNDPATSSTCDDTGTYVFALAGTGFAGRSDQVGTCASAAGLFDNTSSDTVLGGTVSGGQVRYSVGGACQYAATVTSSPDHLAGTATCGTASGTWTADRGLGLTAVAVDPDSTAVPENAAFRLTAVLRNTLGNRVFDRALSWSSDAATIVTVDTGGVVTALQPGTAHILAGASGLSGSAAITVGGTSVTDVVGDTYGSIPGAEVDIETISAASDSGALTLALQLAQPPTGGFLGYLDLDVDQDSTTGVTAQVDIFRPDTTVSSGLGVEFICDLSTGDLYETTTFTVIATVPVYFDAATNTFTARIPVALLGSLHANMAVVVGNPSEPTDIAPDSGHLTLGGAVVSAAATGTTPLRRVVLPWRGAMRAGARSLSRREKVLGGPAVGAPGGRR